MRIATLHKLVKVLVKGAFITFWGCVAFLILAAVLGELLEGKPFMYWIRVGSVVEWVFFPLLGLAIVFLWFATWLNERRLKKFLAKASPEHLAFYKMCKDAGYECKDVDKLISACKIYTDRKLKGE